MFTIREKMGIYGFDNAISRSTEHIAREKEQRIPAFGSSGGINVYFANASALADNSLFHDAYLAVSAYRKEKTDRYCFRKDKNLSLCAEYLLLCGCHDFGIRYSEQTFSLGRYGRPFFPDSGLCFNLSHSEERAMCAISPYEVGCDIEKIGRYEQDIAAYSFSDEEMAALQDCCTEQEKEFLFYRLWTLKESFLKCIGTGISRPMKSFSFLTGGKLPSTFRDRGNNYQLFAGCLDNSYQYALCVKSGDTDYENIKRQICIYHKSLSERQHLSEQ